MVRRPIRSARNAASPCRAAAQAGAHARVKTSLHVLTGLESRSRSTPFSYTCNQCNRCCYDKRIHVNPYEILRIAQALGTTTGDVIATHTEGGVSLANRDDGSCTFLTG